MLASQNTQVKAKVSSQVFSLISSGAVVACSGAKADWSNIEVPVGRSTSTCQKILESIMKEDFGIIMTSGANMTLAKKRDVQRARR